MSINKNAKDQVAEAINAEVVGSTALSIRSDVSQVSQDVMKDEIHSTHLNTMGMMAIENAIDEDKESYDAQLDEIRAAMDVATKELKQAETQRDKTITAYQKRLVNTELKRKYAAAVKVLSKLADLSSPIDVKTEDDIDTCYIEAEHGVAAHIKWDFGLGQKGSSSYRNTLEFKGTRALSKKCLDTLKAVKTAETGIQELQNINKEVRIQIQNLEKERRTLKRKLRQQIVGGSVVGAEVEKMLKGSRKKIKALPLPAKFRK